MSFKRISAILTPKIRSRRNYKVDFLSDFLMSFVAQLQSPTLGFLIDSVSLPPSITNCKF